MYINIHISLINIYIYIYRINYIQSSWVYAIKIQPILYNIELFPFTSTFKSPLDGVIASFH